MKVFIDVNIFIDVMTKRSGWADSLRVLNLTRKSEEIESWTSALTLPLLYFFRRRVVVRFHFRDPPDFNLGDH